MVDSPDGLIRLLIEIVDGRRGGCFFIKYLIGIIARSRVIVVVVVVVGGVVDVPVDDGVVVLAFQGRGC